MTPTDAELVIYYRTLLEAANKDRAGLEGEVKEWRALYEFQTAMRYMDNGIGRETAYRMAGEDVQRMTAQMAQDAIDRAREAGNGSR